MDLDKIQAFNEEQAQLSEERAKTEDMALAVKLVLDSQKDIEDSIKNTLLGVVKFLNNYQPQVSVKNQQPFPSFDGVVGAVNNVVSEVKKSNSALEKVGNKEVDLSSISKSMTALANEVAKLPKTFPKIPDTVKVSNQPDLKSEFDALNSNIQNIDIPAPVVNVPEVKIPDNSKELKDITDAVKKIKFPEIPKTDFSSVEKAVKEVQKAISSLRFPVPNYILPFKDVNGKAVQVQLDANGNVPTSGSGGGSGVAAFSDSGGTDRKGLVDADRHVQVDVLTAPTTAVTGPLTDAQLRASAVPVSGTFYQATQPVSLASVPTHGVAGDVAHDAVDSGNPVKVGGKAFTGTPTAVANGDRVDAWHTQYGALVTSDYDAEIGLSVGATQLRDRLMAERFTVIADSLADGLADFWTSTTANGGTATSTGGEGVISTSASATGSAQLVGRTVRYYPGQVAWFNSAVRFNDTGSAGNVRRIGVFTVSGTTPQDGFYYELDGTDLRACVVKAGVVQSNTISTSWSRVADAPFTLDTNFHSFELRYTANTVWFIVDNVHRHRYSGTNSPITATLDFPKTIQSINTSGATDRLIAVRNCGIGGFGHPPTDNAWAPGLQTYRNAALSNTDQAVKTSWGNVYWINAYNPNATLAYLHFYDASTASVTVGTTTPKLSIAIPSTANGTIGYDVPLPIPITFSTAITVASSTTAGGGTAPGTALVVNIGYA